MLCAALLRSFRGQHSEKMKGSVRGNWDPREGQQPFRPNPNGVGDRTTTLRRLLICAEFRISLIPFTLTIKHRLGATLSLANRAIHDPDHVLHGQWVGQQNAHRGRLRSRHPFVPAAWKLLDTLSELNIRMKQWTKHKWNADYLESSSRIRAFIPRVSSRPLGMSLLRTSWVRHNRLRTGEGRFRSSMYKWGLAPPPNCERGATEQTDDHVISSCLIHHVPRGTQGLQVLDDATRCWLNTTTASI